MPPPAHYSSSGERRRHRPLAVADCHADRPMRWMPFRCGGDRDNENHPLVRCAPQKWSLLIFQLGHLGVPPDVINLVAPPF